MFTIYSLYIVFPLNWCNARDCTQARNTSKLHLVRMYFYFFIYFLFYVDVIFIAVHYMFTIHSLYVHYMFTVCSLYNSLYIVFPLNWCNARDCTQARNTSKLHLVRMYFYFFIYFLFYVDVIFIAVHYMFTIHSLYVHYMFTVCSLYIHYIFIIYCLSSKSMQRQRLHAG